MKPYNAPTKSLRCRSLSIAVVVGGKTKTPPKRGFLYRGADTQSRTGDLTLTKGALSQLSHISTYLVRYPV